MKYCLAILALAFTDPAPSRGFASAYAPGVMEEVVALRFENDWWPVTPPYDWYTAHGAIAVEDCRDVGRMAVLVGPGGEEYRVLVADCGEKGKPGEGGHWMKQNHIVAELDWRLWARLTAQYGRPLEIEIR